MIPDLHLIPGLWKIDGYSKLSRCLQRQFAVTPGRNFFAFLPAHLGRGGS